MVLWCIINKNCSYVGKALVLVRCCYAASPDPWDQEDRSVRMSWVVLAANQNPAVDNFFLINK